MANENTVSVEAGSTAVVGTLTLFTAAEGDIFLLAGMAVEILKQESASLLRLRFPWPGQTLTNRADWRIQSLGEYWRSNVTTNKLVTELIRKIDGGLPLRPDAVGTLAQRDQYNSQAQGFLFLRTDSDPFLLYAKTGPGQADWTEGQRLQADQAQSTQEAIAAAGVATGAASTATDKAGEAAGSATASAESASLSQQWATKTDGEVVAGQGYGAKKYAQDATAEANRAASYIPSGVAKSITGLVPFNDPSFPTVALGVSAGAARDKDNGIDIVLPAAMGKGIDLAWSPGNGGGGLDTGTRANYTYYHVFVIRNPTTSAVDVLFSTSPTAPVMPSGFTQRRRVGMFLTDGTASIMPGLWRADGSFEFKTPLQVGVSDTLGGNLLKTVLNPSGVKVKWHGLILGYNASSAGFWLIARDPDLGPPPAASDPSLPFMSVFYKAGGITTMAHECDVWTDTAGRVYLASVPATTANECNIFTKGFLDLRDELV